jgi:hypothetical protein
MHPHSETPSRQQRAGRCGASSGGARSGDADIRNFSLDGKPQTGATVDGSVVPSLFPLLAVFRTVQDEGPVSHQSAIARYRRSPYCSSHSFADPFAMRSVDRRRHAHSLHQRIEDGHMDQQPAEAMGIRSSRGVSAVAIATPVPDTFIYYGNKLIVASAWPRQRMTLRH